MLHEYTLATNGYELNIYSPIMKSDGSFPTNVTTEPSPSAKLLS